MKDEILADILRKVTSSCPKYGGLTVDLSFHAGFLKRYSITTKEQHLVSEKEETDSQSETAS